MESAIEINLLMIASARDMLRLSLFGKNITGEANNIFLFLIKIGSTFRVNNP